MKKWKRFLIVSLCAIFLSTAIISSYGQGSVVKASESGSNERIITAVASWEILAALLSLFAASGIAVNVSNFMPDSPDVDLPSWNPPQSGIEWESGFDVDNAADSLTEELAKNGVSLPDEVLEKFNGYKPGDDEDGDGHPDSPEDPSDPNSWLEWVKSMVKLGKQHKVGVVTSALLGYMLYDSYNDAIESDIVPSEITSLDGSVDDVTFYSGLYFDSTFFKSNEYLRKYGHYLLKTDYIPAVIYAHDDLNNCDYMIVLKTWKYDSDLSNEASIKKVSDRTITSLSPLSGVYSHYITFSTTNVLNNISTSGTTFKDFDYKSGDGLPSYVGDLSNYRVYLNPLMNFNLNDSDFDINKVIRMNLENFSDSIKNVMSQMNSLSQAVSNVSNSINIPTGQQFSDYIKDLLDVKNPSESQSITNNFINQVTTPVTNPNPDNPSPDEPSVEEPLPDEPAPDEPDAGVNDGSNGLPNLVVKGLKTKFPFCIPFDLIMAFKLFEAPAEAPVWKLPLKVATLGIDYELVIDFNEFEQLAVVLRWIELVSFILSLILITRSKLIKG